MMGFRIGGQSAADVFDRMSVAQYGERLDRIRESARHSLIAITMVREIAIKEALGRWVSELEPVLVYNQHMQFIGLTHAGQDVGGYPPISVIIKDGIPV